jgi:hypothetical protein
MVDSWQTNDKAQAKPSPNVKAQMTNKIPNANDKNARTRHSDDS